MTRAEQLHQALRNLLQKHEREMDARVQSARHVEHAGAMTDAAIEEVVSLLAPEWEVHDEMGPMWTKQQVAIALGLATRSVERKKWLRAIAINVADPGEKPIIRYPARLVLEEKRRRRLAGAGGRAGMAAGGVQ